MAIYLYSENLLLGDELYCRRQNIIAFLLDLLLSNVLNPKM